jgi:hypothetical protein
MTDLTQQIRLAIYKGLQEGDRAIELTERVRAIVGWQPIETAPEGEQLVGRFVGCRLDWMRIAEPHKGSMWKMDGGYCQPTHWLPVPTRREIDDD